MKKESQKCQRRHNVSLYAIYPCINIVLPQKAHTRQRILEKSKSINEETKSRVFEVLKPEFMSSEDSTTDEEETNDTIESDSDDETTRGTLTQPKKKLIRHRIKWRSRECQEMMDSLGRKLKQKRTSRAQAMCLKVETGGDSTRPKPDGVGNGII